ESFAENPGPTDAPSKPPATATTEQKRLNAINSPPVENPTQILRAETPTTACPHPPPRLPPRLSILLRFLPGFLSWPGLLLEKRKVRKQHEPEIPFGSPKGISGNPRKP